jgi:hypothetical protein
VSARAGVGLSVMGALDSSKRATAGWDAMVVGSVAPLSLMEGGVFVDIYVLSKARARAGGRKVQEW